MKTLIKFIYKNGLMFLVILLVCLRIKHSYVNIN